MIQYNYKLNWRAEDEGFYAKLDKVLRALCLRPASKQANAIFVQLTFHNLPRAVAGTIREKIREFLPRAVVAGLTETLFNSSEVMASYVRMNCAFFQKAKVRLLEYDGVPESFGKLGLQFGQKVAAMPDVRAAMVVGVMAPKLSQFLDSFVVGNENVVVFGAIAGMYTEESDEIAMSTSLFSLDADNDMESQFIVGSAPLSHGVVVAVFSGDSLSVRADYTLGWKPLGKEMTITETMGGSGISRLDGMPAVDIYRHYLKVHPDENFMLNIAEFPLVIDRDGCLIARVPPGFDDEGRIFFTGDVHAGEKVRLTYAVPEDFLHETELASEKMSQFAPEGLYLSACGTRGLFLQDRAQLETIYYQRSANQLSVCSGTGEIYYYQGHGGILNCALVAVGFREGRSKSALTVFDELEYHQPVKAPVRLSARVAAFLEAVTQELEQANHNLQEMVRKTEVDSIGKYKFLSGAGHDIAEHLQQLIDLEERISREAGEEHIRRLARQSQRTGQKVYSIMSSIFDFLEMESGNFVMSQREYRTAEVLAKIRSEIDEEAAGKGLKFVIDVPPDLPSVLYGDSLRLQQVVNMLLHNGITYTEKGTIRLAVKMEKTGPDEVLLHFAISDNGPGMTPAQKAEVEQMLSLTDKRPVNLLNDTGLGLNVTQRLLKLVGSELRIESKLGAGTQCYFSVRQRVLSWIPLKSQQVAAAAPEAKPRISEEELAETLEALREIADSCDRESLDYMLETLDGYNLPEREAGLLLELRTAAQEENWALIQKLVQ